MVSLDCLSMCVSVYSVYCVIEERILALLVFAILVHHT